MLTFSTLSEALAELKSHTGKEWSDSELFDCAVNNGLDLHAAPPANMRITASEWVLDRGLVSTTLASWHMAVLEPARVAQLWMTGETSTVQVFIPDQPVELWCELAEPVRVTRAEVRIQGHTILRMIEWYRQAAGGTEFEAAEPATFPTAGPSAVETPKEHRYRLLLWCDDEIKLRGTWGAVSRVLARERVLRPKADSSNVSRNIRKARKERAAEERAGGALIGLFPLSR